MRIKYVIYLGGVYNGYYTGKTYVHQGEDFAVLDSLPMAKRYMSEKRAINAMSSLISKCVNFSRLAAEVKEVAE